MISIKKGNKRVKYFAGKSDFSIISPAVYIQANSTAKLFGYKREPFFTKVLLLDEDIDEMKPFARNTRNEVRKAAKEGVLFDLCNNMDEFISFYNAFAKHFVQTLDAVQV